MHYMLRIQPKQKHFKLKINILHSSLNVYIRGSQTGVHVLLGVHLGFSRGTLLCERISLFKLNSVSGRNNRLKRLEFSNPVDCYYVKQDN